MDLPILVIATDGACRNQNFKDDPKHPRYGGVGVFFGDNDPRNIAAALPGQEQTNNRAELVALQLGLLHASTTPKTQEVHILSDSIYCTKNYNDRLEQWAVSGWTLKSGNPVKNQDIWRQLVCIKKRLQTDRTGAVLVKWVKGHNKHAGNVGADRLANVGANYHRLCPKTRFKNSLLV